MFLSPFFVFVQLAAGGTFQVLKLPLGFIRVLEWVSGYFIINLRAVTYFFHVHLRSNLHWFTRVLLQRLRFCICFAWCKVINFNWINVFWCWNLSESLWPKLGVFVYSVVICLLQLWLGVPTTYFFRQPIRNGSLYPEWNDITGITNEHWASSLWLNQSFTTATPLCLAVGCVDSVFIVQCREACS